MEQILIDSSHHIVKQFLFFYPEGRREKDSDIRCILKAKDLNFSQESHQIHITQNNYFYD